MSADGVATKPATTIDMGGGMTIGMSDEGAGRWKLAFRHDGAPAAQAPPLDTVKVEAIDRKGQCHLMRMFPGPSASEVYASGPTDQAYRARVAVSRGARVDRRDLEFPGKVAYNLVKGPHNGTLISMGHDSYVEVVPVDAQRWKITFLDKDVLAKAPVVGLVKAEAIGDAREEGQIRDLAVEPGNDGSSLLLVGKLADATYLRLAVMMGDHYHTRCVPVLRP